jgi:hypothetical protein
MALAAWDLLLGPLVYSSYYFDKVVSKSLLVYSLGSFKNRITLSTNRDNVSSSFLICISLISLSYFIPLAKYSNTVSSESSESGQLWLVPDFRENILLFCIQYGN